MSGRPHLFELTLSEPERAHLMALAARSLPYSHVRRAQIILASAAADCSAELDAAQHIEPHHAPARSDRRRRRPSPATSLAPVAERI